MESSPNDLDLQECLKEIDSLEKANKALTREKEALQVALEAAEKSLSEPERTVPGRGQNAQPHTSETDSADEEQVHRVHRYRLLWRTAIQSTILAHLRVKLGLLMASGSDITDKLRESIRENSRQQANLREMKKLQDLQSAQLEHQKEHINELHKNHDLEKANMVEERERLVEEFNTQIESMQKQSRGSFQEDNLFDVMMASQRLGRQDDSDSDADLQARVEELEVQLSEVSRSKEALQRQVRKLEDRLAQSQDSPAFVKQLEVQLAEAVAVQSATPQESRSHEERMKAALVEAAVEKSELLPWEGASWSLEDKLLHIVFVLQQELAKLRKSEQEWRERAEESWTQTFTRTFCFAASRPTEASCPDPAKAKDNRRHVEKHVRIAGTDSPDSSFLEESV